MWTSPSSLRERPPSLDSASMNHANFATSENIIATTRGATALVRASCEAGRSNAMLRHQSGSTKILMGIPTSDRALGQIFGVPIAGLLKYTNLWVANTSGTNGTVKLYYGLSTMPPSVTEPIPAWGVKGIPITKPNCNVMLTSDVPVIVQLAMDTGGLSIVETFVLP